MHDSVQESVYEVFHTSYYIVLTPVAKILITIDSRATDIRPTNGSVLTAMCEYIVFSRGCDVDNSLRVDKE